MQLACILLGSDVTFRSAEQRKPDLILRNPINYPSLRTISPANALVMLYQEMIVLYFAFDLFYACDRLFLGDEKYV
jgi:hypothetical protein